MQEELRVRNVEESFDRRMRFRIGINVGDVMVEDGNFYGDGVNVAARLEQLSDAGGVCSSGSAFEQVQGKLSFGFEDIGPQKVKNIAKPIPAFRVSPGPAPTAAARLNWRIPTLAAAFGLLAAAGAVAWWQPWAETVVAADVQKMAFPLPTKPSIAVLPFTNMSDDAKQEYFTDGMTLAIRWLLGGTSRAFDACLRAERHINQHYPSNARGPKCFS
jgi:adenylate cyclase